MQAARPYGELQAQSGSKVVFLGEPCPHRSTGKPSRPRVDDRGDQTKSRALSSLSQKTKTALGALGYRQEVC